MTRGGKFLLIGGCLAASGCVTDQKVQVRPIADSNSKLHYSGGLLAEARGQLAMGAVGLALESLRTLQRQQPDNPEVYAALAACYSEMGRYDISRHNYELALAYAPDSPALLQALASTLDKLGETEQAAQVRDEVRTAAARRVEPALAMAPVTPLGVPRATAMTVKLPEAPRVSSPAARPPSATRESVIEAKQPVASRPTELAQAVDVRIAAPTLGSTTVDLPAGGLGRLSKPPLVAAEVQLALVEQPTSALRVAADFPIRAPVLSSARVDLQSSRVAELRRRAVTPEALPLFKQLQPEAVLLAATTVTQPQPAPPARVDADTAQRPITEGPYLERTSLREVALITVAAPKQRGSLPHRAPQLPELAMIAGSPAVKAPEAPAPRTLVAAAEVRWLPLRYSSRAQPIQILNAARTDGLAARTRIALVDRGWRKVSIGNARAPRQHSLVLYSPGRWHVAARLAAQFRCKAVRTYSAKSVVVLLGRDFAQRRGSTSRA